MVNLQKIDELIQNWEAENKWHKEQIKLRLPVGTVLEIRRGKSDTKSNGWVGPYEVRAHSFHDPMLIILVNLKTRRQVRFAIGRDNYKIIKE